jgi:hypothetical protein
MHASRVPHAIAAATSTARELGLRVNHAVVIHNSDRIAVRLAPAGVLARVGPQEHVDGFQFEAEVARRLAETGSPVGVLDPRADPRVYQRDGFAITLWTYYESVGDIAPADYADALVRFHAGSRQVDLPAPHIDARIAGWARELDDREQTPELPDPERDELIRTLSLVRDVIQQRDADDQLLHGEPHPGNVLGTSEGPRFIDLHTCQCGPIEYDAAFLPEDAAARYPGVNQRLVHEFRVLMWVGFTTMRWRPWDQYPDRDRWRAEGLNQVRATLARG